MNSRSTLQLPTILGFALLCACVFATGIIFLVAAQEYAAFYYHQGEDYQNNGDLELAIESYTKAIKINSDFAEAYYRRGDACYGIGEMELAVQDYERYLQLVPNAPDREEVTIKIDELKSEVVP